MLLHPTLDKLAALKLPGMQRALIDQMALPDCGGLGFDERFGMLVDAECTERDNRQLAAKLKRAKLRQSATIEDIDFRSPRGIDKAVLLALADCGWLRKHHNLIITGPTGTGKSYLACALGHRACREGYRVLYYRAPRLFQELAIARGDGRYDRLLRALARTDLLILDDWGPEKLNDEQRRDLLEIIEDRYEKRSTIVTSQVPVDHWYDMIGNPTLADAILDRLVHRSHRIALKGESMRQKPIDKTKNIDPS